MTGVFVIFFIILGICILLCLVRAVLGPRFTDRIMCANLISTKIIACIVLAGVILKEEFVFDTALIYAMIGFVSVTVLGKMFEKRDTSNQSDRDVTKERIWLPRK